MQFLIGISLLIWSSIDPEKNYFYNFNRFTNSNFHLHKISIDALRIEKNQMNVI